MESLSEKKMIERNRERDQERQDGGVDSRRDEKNEAGEGKRRKTRKRYTRDAKAIETV
jgi:hypothetical protein